MLSFMSCLGFLFEDLNKMNLVFLIFKDNLLTFNHSLKWWYSFSGFSPRHKMKRYANRLEISSQVLSTEFK